MGQLEGKVALVTGAARGQGRSHALRLAEAGVDIVALDLMEPIASVSYPMPTEADLEETVAGVEKLDRRIVARKADVRVRSQVQAVVDEGLATFGRLDIVVANAGIATPGAPFHLIPEQQWDDAMAVNVKGVWNTCAVAVPHLIERGQGGAIVITASGAGLRAAPHIADYVASKHAAVGLMKTMANELAQHYIRVNAVCPSTVDTPMIQNEALYRLFRPDLADPGREDAVEAFRAMNPIPEPWLDVRDISAAVLWLVSDEARYITGVALPVDLGLDNKFL